MRDIAFLLLIIAITPFTLKRPIYAAMAYAWISVMVPHRLMWGFAFSLPLAMYFGGILLVALMTTKEPLARTAWHRYLPAIAFLGWTTITTLTALAPELAFAKWNEFLKMNIAIVMTMFTLTDRRAIMSLIWVLALSLGFYGAKGGIFTILHGGAYRIWGPPGSPIEDNNHLAVALLATLPLMLWLRELHPQKIIRLPLATIAFLSTLSALATYSRGGMIAAIVGGTFLLIRTNHRLPIIVALTVFIPLFINYMPQEYWDRINTITTYDEDASARARLTAWKIAVDVANSSTFGGGFNYYYSPSVAEMNPDEPGRVRAAHSIYFDVLGGHGWTGLALYFSLIAHAFWTLHRIRSKTKKKLPEFLWAYSLAGYLQASIVFVLAGGAFLSMAFWEFFFYLIALTHGLYFVTQQPAGPAEIFRGRFHYQAVETCLVMPVTITDTLHQWLILQRQRSTFMRLARRLANRYAWCARASPNTLTTRASAVSVPARMSSGSTASHTESIRITAAARAARPRTRRPRCSATSR